MFVLTGVKTESIISRPRPLLSHFSQLDKQVRAAVHTTHTTASKSETHSDSTGPLKKKADGG